MILTKKKKIIRARLKLRSGEYAAARGLAEMARENFGSYVDVFFPDDLRPLLTLKSDLDSRNNPNDHMLGMLADVMEELSPSTDFEILLARTVKATNRFFGAERGGIFWFRNHGAVRRPVLRGACNLMPGDIEAGVFKSSLAIIFKAFHENQPQVFRRDEWEGYPSTVKAMISVPFSVEGQTRGVLYHDNSYVRDCFDSFDKTQLSLMARWLTSYIEHIFMFSRRMEQKAANSIGQFDSAQDVSIIADSPQMRDTLAQADRIAATASSVLILGETGVGKELLARRIHNMSPRRNNPLITVDLTVIPENLVESELFGHEKGAFTGADRQKKGRLELAHLGTLFIDEVGEIPKSIQVKLLRAIQEKTMVRIGGTQTILSDFRIISATNRDLAAEVAAGRFREDLYYRLNVIPITLPPLRERFNDVILLARHFLQRFTIKYNRPSLELTRAQETMLSAYSWPGNVRELQNIMERAAILSADGRLELNLPTGRRCPERDPFADMPSLDEIQRRYIQYVLARTGGKLGGPNGASAMLGMKRTTLFNRMKKLGLK